MKKNIIYAMLMLPMLWGLASCSDDKDEPKDELLEVTEKMDYMVSYPAEFKLLNSGRTYKAEYLWRAFEENWTPVYPFGFIAATWGDVNCAMTVRRTDGKPLEILEMWYFATESEIERDLDEDPKIVAGLNKPCDSEKRKLDLKKGEKYKTDKFCITRTDEYSYEIVMKPIDKDNEIARTRLLRLGMSDDFVPVKLTSENGRAEYKLSDKVLELVPRHCMVAVEAYTPETSEVTGRKNVLMRDLLGGKILESKR